MTVAAMVADWDSYWRGFLSAVIVMLAIMTLTSARH